MIKRTGTVLIILFIFAVAICAETLDATDILFTELLEGTQPVKIPDTAVTSKTIHTVDVKTTESQWDNFLRLSSVNFADSLDTSARENFNQPQASVYITADKNLIEANIAAPVAGEKQQTSDTLQQMIEQIRSVKFERKKDSSEHLGKEEPVLIQQAEEVDTEQAQADETEQQKIESPQIKQEQAVPEDIVSELTLKQIQRLIEQPEQAENPLMLAEILALSEHYEQAAVLYGEALSRAVDNQQLSIHDKAWLLLQTASCQKICKSEQALNTYKELLTQCPSSIWVNVAKAQSQMLDWQQAEKPRELIDLCKAELNNRRTQ